LLVLATYAPAFCQSGRHPGDAEEPLASFSGTVRDIGGKTLTIRDSDSRILEFYCSKKTKYFDGDKKLNPSGVRSGDYVVVEARHAPDGTLDAVNVRLDDRREAESP
jgi:hypothetical protein